MPKSKRPRVTPEGATGGQGPSRPLDGLSNDPEHRRWRISTTVEALGVIVTAIGIVVAALWSGVLSGDRSVSAPAAQPASPTVQAPTPAPVAAPAPTSPPSSTAVPLARHQQAEAAPPRPASSAGARRTVATYDVTFAHALGAVLHVDDLPASSGEGYKSDLRFTTLRLAPGAHRVGLSVDGRTCTTTISVPADGPIPLNCRGSQ
jgi:hypothetical protein